ncbi:MAG TPA: hypothetical protein VJQ81_17430 [Reyranella sp.]|jgi:hypothetical protein|nr:hypothetical protein [Reyranella sp.]
MSDNVISLDERRRGKPCIVDRIVAPSAEEIAAKAAVAAQTAVDQEERGRLHMVLVNATTQVLDPRPLSTENRLEIARGLVRAILGPAWRVTRR